MSDPKPPVRAATAFEHFWKHKREALRKENPGLVYAALMALARTRFANMTVRAKTVSTMHIIIIITQDIKRKHLFKMPLK